MSGNEKLFVIIALLGLCFIGLMVYLFIFTDPANFDEFDSQNVTDVEENGDSDDSNKGAGNHRTDTEQAATEAPEEDEPVDPRVKIKPREVNVYDYGQVMGKVLNEKKKPVAGAEVILYTSYNLSRKRIDQAIVRLHEDIRTYTDDQGKFFLQNIPAPGNYQLVAVKEGYAPLGNPTIKVKPRTLATAPDLLMGKGWRVFGRVTGEGDQPIEGATVFLDTRAFGYSSLEWDTDPVEEAAAEGKPKPEGEEEPLPLPWKSKLKTDAMGQFTFPAIGSGNYEVGAWAKGYAMFVKTKVNTQEKDPKEGIELNFKLEPAKQIKGVVIDPEGTPIYGAQITAFCDRGSSSTSRARTRTSKEDGWFTLDHLHPGRYIIQARKIGFLPGFASNIEAGASSVTIILKNTSTLFGTVTDRAGKPMKNFSITACSVLGGNVEEKRPLTEWVPFKTQDGSFKMKGLQRGSYVCVARADGFGDGVSELVKVEDGETGGPLSIQVEPGFSLTGRVISSKRKPIANARVELVEGRNPARSGGMGLFGQKPAIPNIVQEQEPYNRNAITNSKGEFQIDHAKPGTYTLKVSHPEYKNKYVPDIKVAAKKVNKAGKVTMDQGGSLICRVLDGAGKPSSGRVVTVTGVGIDTAYFGRTDDNGAFQMNKMTPGTYALTLPSNAMPFLNTSQQPAAPAKVTAYVEEGEVAEVVLYAP